MVESATITSWTSWGDEALLSRYRVLDLTNERGLIAGMILADAGADVVQIEPPGGSSARRLGPFDERATAPENSLFWRAYARNKRGMALDFETPAGKQRLLSLVERADFFLESFEAGYLESIGLGYEHLASVNPALVMASITPFGQTGPKAHWPASDLTVMAASHYQIASGDEDRAPLRIAVPQAFLHAGAEAAVACLVALQERKRSGRGQHIDVSAQQAASMCTLASSLAVPWGDAPNTRVAGGMKLGAYRLRFTYPAKDGYVSVSFFFGSAVGPATNRLMAWIEEAGMADESLAGRDWAEYGALLLSGRASFGEFVRAQETVARFTATMTKKDLFEEARRRRVYLAPVSTAKDLLESEHLAARQFWVAAGPDATGPFYPGPFAKFSESPLRYQRRAPMLGEHTSEIVEQLAEDRRQPVRRAPAGGAQSAPLKGLRVLDLTWVVAGPAATRTLADFGATVVRVESSKRVDAARTQLPFKDGVAGPERSAVYANYNAGKLGLALNLAKPEAREVIRGLAAWADVLTESFTPQTMPSWDLGYEDLRAVNPKLIYLSSCLAGAYGPYSQLAGYGNIGASMAGFNYHVSWPDRPPAGPAGAYTDYMAPKFVAASVLAALEYRQRTGSGQHIDLSQTEAAMHFLGPALLDYTVNGHGFAAHGNRSLDVAPHGVFPCAGEDRWVAVAIETDDQWRALCQVIGNDALTIDRELDSLPGRKRYEDIVEAAITDWTSLHTAEYVQERLISSGIPSHLVADHRDIYADEQLAHRNHFIRVPHKDLGEVVVEQTRFLLSRTPAETTKGPPTYGEDADYVLKEILGMADGEIAELAATGALE